MDTYVSNDAMLDELSKCAAGIPKFLLRFLRGPGREAAGAAAAQSAGKGILTEGIVPYLRAAPGKVWEHLKTPAARGRLVGAVAGGTGGATYGAATGEDTKDRIRRALLFGVLGAGAGTGIGQVSTKAGRAQVKRFGQRQAHSFTGYVPRTKEQVEIGATAFPGFYGTSPTRGWTTAAYQEGLGRMGLEVDRAAELGLTSLPGLARGLRPGRVGETAKAVWKSQGPWGAVGLAGMTVPFVPGEYRRAKAEGGSGSEVIGRSIGSTAGYFLGAPVPLVGQMALGDVMGRVGGLAGKGIGRVIPSSNRAPQG